MTMRLTITNTDQNRVARVTTVDAGIPSKSKENITPGASADFWIHAGKTLTIEECPGDPAAKDKPGFGTPPNPGIITSTELLAHAQALYEYHASHADEPEWSALTMTAQTTWHEMATLAAHLNGRVPVQSAG